MRVLIEEIWHSQSVLSGNVNRYMLRFCRWIRKEPWSPWNSVLLTEEEAIAHLNCENLALVCKHLQKCNHFFSISRNF